LLLALSHCASLVQRQFPTAAKVLWTSVGM
jgi:hypothetical protein